MTTLAAISSEQLCQSGRAIVLSELHAIQSLIPKIDANFATACQRILSCQGRVIAMGMGKSGHICKKIAATLASTGTPAYYIHPAEASHGDLGMIMHNDLCLMISNSGETTEILQLIPLIKKRNIPIIAMTGNTQSTLAQQANTHLDVSIEKEAGLLGLAPTCSTTASLVMGDALALTLLEARGFTSDDFALFHPGGSLGKQLLITVDHLMHRDHEIPKVYPSQTISQTLIEITRKRLGMSVIIDTQENAIGIFTDGDLRRSLDQGVDIHSTLINTVMTRKFCTIEPELLASEALTLLRQKKITSLVVLNNMKQLVGVLHMHDILRAGIH